MFFLNLGVKGLKRRMLSLKPSQFFPGSYCLSYLCFTYCTPLLQGVLNPSGKVLTGDNKPEAQFGSAIASIGDINRDGFPGMVASNFQVVRVFVAT